jgi:uncharacterized protein (TIGR02302 family)
MDDPARSNEPPAKDDARQDSSRLDASHLLERLIRRSVAALVFERVWRVVVALATVSLLFLAVSWSGLWREVGVYWRIFGVFAFALAALALSVRAMLGGALSRARALARLDAAAYGQLRPATSLDDTLAGGDRDPATATLWTLHRRRLERALRVTPVAPPRPRVAEYDPFALRAAALIAAVAAGFVAGGEREARLRAAFDWRGVGVGGLTERLDAWLDPPAYTGLPPVVVSARSGSDEPSRTIAAPVHSILHVRSSGRADFTTGGGLEAIAQAEPVKARAAFDQNREQKFTLTGDARLVLGGEVFDLAAIPDHAPTIALTAAPRNNARGSLTLAYRTEDDYGVISAEAVFSRPLIDGKVTTGRMLIEPPKLSLSLPGARGIGEAQSTLAVADHPWAGAHATMVLVARDEGGNEGFSAPVEIILPQRRFTKPLARALVEQRRNLVLDPDQRATVLSALDALSLAPELFATPSSIFLGLQTARDGLKGKRSDDELRAVADTLWAMALSLEDGDLSNTERDLRAAERNLREALSRGAGEEEIARLTEELRSALDKFLEALTLQAMRDGANPPAPHPDGKGRTLSEQDLKSMLDQMAKAGKAGDLAQAQQLLDDLQDMLENLQPSRGAGADPRSREMSRSLGEIDRLSREQQQLRDDTHRGRAEDEPGEARAMRDRQKALREKLEQQQDRLRQLGEEAPRELKDADKAMKEAEDALGKGGLIGKDRAVDAQGRALQALRRGADQLASKMKGEGEDGGDDEGRGPGRARAQGDDPLGRSAGRNGRNNDRARYDPLGLPPAIRAHRVQEELRRRLGEPGRPADELDYIERLLRR